MMLKLLLVSAVLALLVVSALADGTVDCPEVCASNFSPVCSTNSVTFSNECELRKASCEAFAPFTVLHQNACTDTDCPVACVDSYEPVCSNTGETFVNECELNKQACAQKKVLFVKSTGECQQSQPACDVVCANVYEPVCMNGVDFENSCSARRTACSQSLAAPNILQGTCTSQTAAECETMCTQDFQPVCGSDGFSYSNECQLSVQSCRSRSQLTVKHQGSCVAADCDVVCTADYNPVCAKVGTDSVKTFANLCEISQETCKSNFAGIAVTTLHQGECTSDDIASVSDCNQICTASYEPVCSSDFQTFSNLCLLQAEACKSRKTVSVLHQGACVEADCQIACTKELAPVCAVVEGTTATTFSNKCLLAAKTCLVNFAGVTVALLHEGACTQEDQDKLTAATEECDTVCTQDYQPICGSDYKTYNNACSLKAEACQLKKTITTLHEGACVQTDCAEISCTQQYEPVCAVVDGKIAKTLPNACELARESCVVGFAGTTASLLHQGECTTVDQAALPACDDVCTEEYEPVCFNGETFGNACFARSKACQLRVTPSFTAGACAKPADDETNCDVVCPQVFTPVCGSDLKTYSNLCNLQADACRNKKTVTVKHEGACASTDCTETICTEEYAPVCASVNGKSKTLPNECTFNRESCENSFAGIAFTLSHQGECTVDDGCPADAQCAAGLKCVAAVKECFTTPCPQYDCVPEETDSCDQACTMDYKPVCGSDLTTYSNPCALEVAACKNNAKGLALKTLHEGSCAKQDCDIACPKIYDPVCTTTGRTFGNLCQLRSATCEASFSNTADAIGVFAYDGECKKTAEAPVSASSSESSESSESSGSATLAAEVAPNVALGSSTIAIIASVVGFVVLAAVVAGVIIYKKRTASAGFEPLLQQTENVYEGSSATSHDANEIEDP